MLKERNVMFDDAGQSRLMCGGQKLHYIKMRNRGRFIRSDVPYETFHTEGGELIDIQDSANIVVKMSV